MALSLDQRPLYILGSSILVSQAPALTYKGFLLSLNDLDNLGKATLTKVTKGV